jgi:hypothetical protein
MSVQEAKAVRGHSKDRMAKCLFMIMIQVLIKRIASAWNAHGNERYHTASGSLSSAEP